MVDVIDVSEDGQPEWEIEYETCMMCGNEKIRYVHIVEHAEVGEEFRVGCTCAEKSGNHFLNIEQHHLLIYRNKKTNKYKVGMKALKVAEERAKYIKANKKK